MTDNPMKAAMDTMRPEAKTEPAKPKNAYVTPNRQGKHGFTIFLDPIPHTDLKQIALDEGTTLTALAIEGLNYVLQKRGKPVIA